MSARRDRCATCGQRFADDGWAPFCCEVCWDSADAAERRLVESGALDDPGNRQTEHGVTRRPEGR